MTTQGSNGAVANMDARPPREAAIALVWAILVMLVVTSTIIVSVGMSLLRSDETRDDANRTRSSLWTQAAADDLVQRLQSGEIGYDLAAAPSPTVDTPLVVRPPATAPAAGRSRFANGGTTVAKRITFTQLGRTYTGWYQVLPLPGTAVPWRAAYRRSPLQPHLQGSIEMVVRVWEDGMRAEPATARLTFRHASFSRFSILSDDKLVIGGSLGIVGLGGYVHSNNARGLGTAITLSTGVALAGVRKITTTTGAISGSCPSGTCVRDVRDVVEFGSASRAFDRIRQQAAVNTPIDYDGLGVSRYMTGLAGGANAMPTWWVDLAACGDGIMIGRGSFPLRDDTVGVPALDDASAPALGGGGCFPVAEGGGAVLFDGDVLVRGLRSSTRPVTIMAQRVNPLPVRLDADGDGAKDDIARVTMPASVYMAQTSNGAGFGSANAGFPVGLVAEGGVYLPSYAMRSVNDRMYVRNVAAMAMGSEVSYGPSIIAVAAETNEPGLGLLPSAARNLGYGYGTLLDWQGSIASRRPAVFRYGTGATYLGYGQRQLKYPQQLLWNPPPAFPSDRDWHVGDVQEYRG